MSGKSRRLAGIACLLLLAGNAALAQIMSGTIQAISQDDGVIVVSGQKLIYREGEVRIRYDGREIPSVYLRSGMRVTYRANAQGHVTDIIIAAPDSELEKMDNN